MTTIEAIIERASDGTFTVYCKDEIFSGAGSTIDAAKADMSAQIAFYKKTARETGFKYPAFLDGDYEIHYTVDATSMMKYYGYDLYTVQGSPENIKITTPGDFYTFRALVDAKENLQIFGI